MKRVIQSFRFRKVALAVADAFIITVASLITNLFMTLPRSDLLKSVIMSVICCFFSLFICGAYNKLWRYFKVNDYLSCVYGIIIGIFLACIINFAVSGIFPAEYAIIHSLIAIIGICLFRYIFKTTFIELTGVNKQLTGYKKTMFVGAGKACEMMIKEIHNAQQSVHKEQASALYNPVCIIDDDISKIGTEIEGIMVVGTSAEIKKYVKEYGIEQIIFAIPSCLEEERQRILNICSDTEVPVKILPFIGNLVFDNDKDDKLMSQIRDIKVEDLLGRAPITFDNQDIMNFISGKVCMVTGGGGSIGSELVRQIAKYNPKQIIIVDIYENNAYDIQQELTMEYGGSLNLVTLIASVRDYFRMNQIFEKYKPQIVFHAAAHKHVPLMEVSPMEAIKNNVIGTFNTATLAQFHDVEKFVMISTDKAVNPTNVMGASKRCCEMIVQYLSQQSDGVTEFVTTRFGNVLGSNGSVIPLFKRQIEQGKPVTVTHPDIIRYFMTIPEAVSLVMEAAAIANGGEIFVLDMGMPVRIVALAENLIRMYGKVPYKDVEIKFTGLRPGEKIKEELLMNEEGLQKTSNKLIFIGRQIDIDEEHFAEKLRTLRDAALKNNEAVAVEALREIVPTFITPEEFNSRQLVKAKTSA
ncbi:MAG: polysaccharide biosynthesis protein [Ruminococcus flavefaciens]|nr:polysaccharide biosynthesis protein [Ruminococcus flavefaciens]MCM1229845.1 polysaccharide biosynthesis protein [Ruminococcus flavefaciens]